MNSQKELFSHAATVLAVANMEQSLEYYENKLGFTCNFKWNDPIDYAVLKRGEVSIHLTIRDDSESISKDRTSIYIFVHDVDAVYQEFSDKKVTINTPVGDREYRMREFEVRDPDGYIIGFGKKIE
jgi:uncharacterized glyoxalase superfamily protein PhnB